MTTEIETVTVTFEELKANLVQYGHVLRTSRVMVIRDGEEIPIGVRLPGEERILTPQRLAIYRDLFPPEPVDYENALSRALEEVRGYRPFT